MESVKLEDLDSESLIEMLNIFQGMDDELEAEEEVDEDE